MPRLPGSRTDNGNEGGVPSPGGFGPARVRPRAGEGLWEEERADTRRVPVWYRAAVGGSDGETERYCVCVCWADEWAPEGVHIGPSPGRFPGNR